MSDVEDKLASVCRFLKTSGATRGGQKAEGFWPSFSVVAGDWYLPDGGILRVYENGTTEVVYPISTTELDRCCDKLEQGPSEDSPVSNPEAGLNWAETRLATAVYEGLQEGLRVYEIVDTVRIATSEYVHEHLLTDEPHAREYAQEAVRILDECCDELRQSLPEGM